MTTQGDAWLAEMWTPCRELSRGEREMDRAAYEERQRVSSSEREAARLRRAQLADLFGDAQDIPESA